MFRKQGSLILFGTFLLITWNAILLFLLWGRPTLSQLDKPRPEQAEAAAAKPTGDVMGDVLEMADSIAAELETQKEILLQIRSHQSLWRPSNKSKANAAVPTQPVIPILVIACNRVTVRRCLDKLLEHRPSEELHPIIVSQDCGHADTAEVIRSYGKRVAHLQQPDLSDVAVKPQHKKFQGYYKISRHYHWALNQVFRRLSHSAVVIVEDDLEVAPDFFEYFRATLPLLEADPSLWCVSAWNDNGRDGYVDPGKAELLYRTDFFPGLGWMLLKEQWEELEPKWPASFWDDWMRDREQRRNRGLPSAGDLQNFDLWQAGHAYRKAFEQEVYGAPLVTYEEVAQGQLKGPGPFRLQYSSRDSFKLLAKNLGIMDDLKSGVPRTGYRGIVTFVSRGRRVFLAPPPGWSQYDTTWS
ncbi:unnamed protein product [Tetraodon nigroviridis]|uniref:Alpha-1,3-mannosyl-glycoprotein 2-beta-N-acetylglucosaminyltransferase n=1 Tax=Tetraodon nigroviridis TaxID=99883 RepID=Q4S9E5_TETNG|nr:unnamed protein product [Tetraodon nigroviridis]